VNGRPVNLDIKTLQLPITAYASILHRITGLLLCLGVLGLLWVFARSLESEAEFLEVRALMGSAPAKLLIFLVLIPFVYHLLAGVRHLIMDAGVGESFEGGVRGARLVFAFSLILIVALGGWLWLA
jgi:succinate dehydrogenase / fumarate reductase cytochrome b subunit